ncbi:hypothetical protein BJ170DRAFT_358935 [Xylariales sp. AK1849]|nr:hypothetical protein BJ170DRAFT_358935 [Xylariales sp. AK1849]
MEKREKQESILDRHNIAIAQIMKRFLNMVVAATEPITKDTTLEAAMLNSMTMETETAALLTEVRNLLGINREIKALWVKGPLRKPGEDASRQAELDKKAEVVQDLYNQLMAMREQQMKEKAQREADTGEGERFEKKKGEAEGSGGQGRGEEMSIAEVEVKMSGSDVEK